MRFYIHIFTIENNRFKKKSAHILKTFNQEISSDQENQLCDFLSKLIDLKLMFCMPYFRIIYIYLTFQMLCF